MERPNIPEICQNVATGLVILDENFMVLDINHEIERKGVISKDYVIGKNFLGFVNEGDLEKTRDALIAAKNGDVVRLMARIKTPQTDCYWVYLRFERYKSWILVSMIDTNKMVEHEHTLVTRNRELESIYSFVQAVSGVVDLEELYEITYRELSKIVENIDAFIINIIDKDAGTITADFVIGEGHKYPKHTKVLNDKDTLSGWVAMHDEILHIRNIHEDDLPAHPKLIGVPMNTWVGIPLKYHNEVIGVISVQSKKIDAFSDEHVRLLVLISSYLAGAIYSANLYARVRESEARYRGIVNMSMVGFVFLDKNGRVTFANDAFSNILGYSREEMLNMHYLELVAEEAKERAIAGKHRREQGYTDVYELTLLRKDGKKVPVIVYATPIKKESGDYEGTMVALADISIVKKLERELKESKQFQELLLHVLSHDIKTPLGVIMGYAELLREGYDEEFVSEIVNAAENILEMLKRIRLLSKLDMGRIEDALEEFSIIEAIKNVVSTVQKRYPKGKITIVDEDVTISGYRALFDEMILNLLTNAFKHGAKNVQISVKVHDTIQIRVEDDGPGIPDDRKQRIFEPFSRGGKGVAGLGLSIVKRVAEIHGGKIWVENNEPHGAVFVVELPLKNR